MSSVRTEGPAGPFLAAVGAATLTATAMLGAGIWLDGAAVARPPLPLLILFIPIVTALVIAVSAALIGLPLTWLLARRRRETRWTYPAAGLAAGSALLVGFFQIGSAGAWRPAGELLVIASLGGVPGFVCGLAWWRLYRRHFRAELGE